MAGSTIVVIEDAPEMRILVTETLKADGFDVVACPDATSGLEAVAIHDPAVVVLDLVLPDMDGLEVCRRIRDTRDNVFVLMLTGKSDDVDAVIGLSVGADDYMAKPFSPRLLVARIRALLRRGDRGATPEPAGDDVRTLGRLVIDDAAREVRLDGTLVDLTRIEYDLLKVLSSRPRQVFTRATLLERVWGSEWAADQHLLDVHVSKLRRKLGDSPQVRGMIHTVRGVGYRFDVPADDRS
ncbi:response regulator transcription factor [Euzebya rosea]|uniref:response regulator transcription factor n=1 Tax=Euzebya rosea TaxID=2052804 RepID=UPI00196A3C07|nr:response regulator transcription factor [Euzebya rosea]